MAAGVERVKVISYNVLAQAYANYANDWVRNNADLRVRLLAQKILAENPDVACLQEVDNYEGLRAHLEQRGYVGVYQRRTSRQPDGVAIFYKRSFTILNGERGQVINFRDSNPQDDTGRVALHLKLRAPGGSEIDVIDTHLQGGPPPGGNLKYTQMAAILRHIREIRGPLAICGDFNTPPNDLEMFEPLLISRPRLEDAHARIDLPSFINPAGQRERIDYIFVSEGMQADAAHVIGNIDQRMSPQEPSDHLLLSLSISLPVIAPIRQPVEADIPIVPVAEEPRVPVAPIPVEVPRAPVAPRRAAPVIPRQPIAPIAPVAPLAPLAPVAPRAPIAPSAPPAPSSNAQNAGCLALIGNFFASIALMIQAFFLSIARCMGCARADAGQQQVR